MRRLRFAVTAALALAACTEDPEGPPAGEPGALELTLSGQLPYAAEGDPEFVDGAPVAATFATAFTDSVGGLVIAAFRADTIGTRGDLFILQLTERRTGEFGACGVGADCHGRMLDSLDAENPGDVARFWEIDAGTVSVTQAGDRIVGVLDDVNLTTGNELEPDRFIDSGTFDLPLLSGSAAVAMMRCFLESATGGACE